jgi:glutathione S-transferase
LLPINVDPAIADYHRRRAETALTTLDGHLAHDNYLCSPGPTIADLFCYGDLAFAEICAFDVKHWSNLERWAQNVRALPGFKAPFELLAMEDAEIA